VLVLRPGALGDTLLAVPALRALRRSYGSITLAAHEAAAHLLVAAGEVDAALSFDDPRVGKVLSGAPAGEPIVAWAQGVQLPEAVLVAASRPADDTHCAEYLLRSLAPLGVSQELDARPLRVQAVPSDEVLVHPGSGSRTKNWPSACFAALIGVLPRVRMIVGEADDHAASEVERCTGRALPRLQEPTLAELAARLAGCRAYVGNDSGVSHLAGLSGAPCHVLFGPTSPAVWRPLGPRVRTYGFDAAPEVVAMAVLA
jgi:ADP-heptose:LPS heptosyltransferase